jgi:hypothetical protein
MKRTLTSVLAATAVLAGGLLATGPAGAANGDRAAPAARAKLYCIGNDHGAYACFQPYGDKVWVKDTTANGMSAAAVWKTSYGREGVCMNIHGKGTWVACNYEMRENRFIRFWSVDVDRPTNSYRNWSLSRRVRI